MSEELKRWQSIIEVDPTVIDELTRYSKNEISSTEVVRRTGIKSHSQLLDLLGLAELKFPSLPENRIDEMVEEISSCCGLQR